MKTYLLTWNPDRWSWHNIQECIADIRNDGSSSRERWSTGVNKTINPGDPIFILRQASEPRGIVASGVATSEVFRDKHWDKTKPNETALFINTRLEFILDADNEAIYSRDWLMTKDTLKDMHWDSHASGTIISDEIAATLEIEWERFIAGKQVLPPVDAVVGLPGEIISSQTQTYYEGAMRQVMVNSYERDAKARKKCIDYYKLACSVCSFNFGQSYGDIGEGFIHVHHLKPLSEIRAEYKVDPIQDLRPVCPNCHAMLHRKKEAPYTYSIEELKAIMAEVKSSQEFRRALLEEGA